MHVHEWEKTEIEAKGIFRKDNWPRNNYMQVPGILERCDCGEKRIIPHSKELPPVEVIEE